MTMAPWLANSSPVPGSPGAVEVVADAAAWFEIAGAAAASAAHLLALWATAGDAVRTVGTVRAAFLVNSRLLIVTLPIADATKPYRGLHGLFQSAARMQRAAFDLTGIRSDAQDQRPWLRHAAWVDEPAPLSPGSWHGAFLANSVDDYAFVRVEGDGVHEIAVGPVHAGIIEPGHFRFSVVGEKVLRLEQRLGYVHKGIERRFTELEPFEAQRLAARISGDSAVAYSWAYCQALEGLFGITAPARALHLRALALELERLQNHLGDLGALGNDAGFAFGLSQFSRLKEMLARAMHEALGQRYLLDFVLPGGSARDINAAAIAALTRVTGEIGVKVAALRAIYDEHAGVRDRFVGAGQVSPALALQLGLCGLAGRASGQKFDLRVDQPWPPYAQLGAKKCTRLEGDVAARVDVRFDEAQESCALIARILKGLPGGATRGRIDVATVPGLGVGLIEGWRGPVLIALDVAADGKIRRCHAHDPSWQNWPVLEHAIIGNIVPDFPLINKSFNLSYSGHDL
jgi:Ni,Fe-hydrogenase III large subunit